MVKRRHTISTVAAVLLAAGCAGAGDGGDTPVPPVQTPGWAVQRFAESGGRVAWYRGPAAHDLIAYDAITGPAEGTEVFITGDEEFRPRCLTCAAGTPKGFVGQPSWHPDGERLVIQVESSHSAHTYLNHMAWGVDNDLWIIRRDGGGAEPIWRTPRRHAALHPHFSRDGLRLLFAERVPTGRRLPRVLARLNQAVDGENQWDGWRLHLAEVRTGPDGRTELAGHRAIQPLGPGFYETHGFRDNGRIVFSFTSGGRPYVDDIYESDADGGNLQRLIDSPTTWDEHGSFSPSGRALAFISSRADLTWAAPRSRANTLRTELHLQRPDGEVVQLTALNRSGSFPAGVLVSDFDWDRSGRRILFQAAPRQGRPQLWILRFNDPQ